MPLLRRDRAGGPPTLGRYPAAAALIRAEITLDRYRLLKTIQ